jgi:putative thioredoxin
MVDGFQGALPPEELDRFLDQVAPGGPAPAGDRRVEAARALADKGRADEAIGRLRELLRDEPDHQEARLTLVEILLDADRALDARKVLERVPDDPAQAERRRALEARLDFAEKAGDREPLEARVRSDPSDLRARIDLAGAHIAAGDHAAGLEHLLEVVRQGEGELRAEAKRAMLEAFDILGLEDPVANDYRFKLSLELFS